MTGPLAGVRVVVLAGMGPVPFVSMVLADLGASVVRVTRPRAGADRALVQTQGLSEEDDVVNRGVESLDLDLKDPFRRADLLRLLQQADVLIEGYRPGVAERLGLGPETVLEANPGLLYARLTGWGQHGPMATMAGHDINYVAQSGALAAMAREGEAPRPPINLLGDYAGGGLLAALGVVAGIVEARASGQGQVIDVAMLDGVALLTARLHGLRSAGLYSDVAGTNYLDSGAPFYDTYRCQDGRYLAVGALEPAFYRTFLDLLDTDTSDWPEQGDRSRWAQLRGNIAAELEKRPRDEWARIFVGTDACVSPVLSFDEAEQDLHNRERGVFTVRDGVLHPAPAPRFSRTSCDAPRPTGQAHESVADLLLNWDRT